MLYFPVANVTGETAGCYTMTPNKLAGLDWYANHRQYGRRYTITGKIFPNRELYYSRTRKGHTEEMLSLDGGIRLYRGVKEKALLDTPGPLYGIAYGFMAAQSTLIKIAPQDVCKAKNNGKHIIQAEGSGTDEQAIEVLTKYNDNRLDYHIKTGPRYFIKGYIGFGSPDPFPDSMSLYGWTIVRNGKIMRDDSFTLLSQLRVFKKEPE